MTDYVIYNSHNRITQHYGKDHKGVDLGYSKDEDKNVVYANCQGVVVEVVNKYENNTRASGAKSWGNYVYIRHTNGYYSRYAHLKKGSISVKVNANVDDKTPIGIIGDSGRAFGRHLHFEVSKAYTSAKRIDPESYLTHKICDEYTPGVFKIIVSKAVRKTHELSTNIVKVKDCPANLKTKLTSKKANAKAYLKVDSKVNITETFIDSKYRVWGKVSAYWIVLQNADGSKQAKRINE